MFVGTTSERFLFLPMYYIKHLVNLIKNQKYNGFSHLPIKVTCDEMNNLKSIEKYDTIKENDIIVAVDNLEINSSGEIYVKQYKNKFYFDDYVLLNCDKKCSLTVIRNFQKKEIIVSCKKVK